MFFPVLKFVDNITSKICLEKINKNLTNIETA